MRSATVILGLALNVAPLGSTLWAVPATRCHDVNHEYALVNAEPPLAVKDINYRDYGGAGKEVVVLIHGLNGSQETWNDVAASLRRYYRVITYDQRGHGGSVARGKRYTNATMARDLSVLLDGLGVGSAMVVGHSMGGRTAIKFAELYPERVKKLVVEDMHIRGADVDFELTDRTVAKMRAMPKFFDSKQQALAMLIDAYGGQHADWARGSVDGMQRNADGKYYFAFRIDIGELYESYALYEDLAPALARVQAPTLFVRADERVGAVLTPEGAEQVLRAKPDAKVVRIDGSDHSVHHSKPDRFLQLVGDFLANGR